MGSFMAASSALGLTQPAVSRSVRELERTLGVELFDRSQRGAHLTGAGSAMFQAAEAALDLLSGGIQSSINPGSSRELLRIGALPNISGQSLPGIVADLRRAHPNVGVRVVTGVNADLLSRLRQGGLDVVIGRLAGSEAMHGIAFEHLYDEEIIFAVAPGHPLLAEGRTIGIGDILDHDLILPASGTIIREEFERFLARNGFLPPEISVEALDTLFISKLSETAQMVAVAAEGLITDAVEAGRLVVLPLRDAVLAGPVGISLLPAATQTPAMKTLLRLLRARHPLRVDIANRV